MAPRLREVWQVTVELLPGVDVARVDQEIRKALANALLPAEHVVVSVDVRRGGR